MHIIEALVFGFLCVFVCALRFTGERDETHYSRGILGIFCIHPRPVAACCEPVHRHGRA